jgi:hypothetical protein
MIAFNSITALSKSFKHYVPSKYTTLSTKEPSSTLLNCSDFKTDISNKPTTLPLVRALPILSQKRRKIETWHNNGTLCPTIEYYVCYYAYQPDPTTTMKSYHQFHILATVIITVPTWISLSLFLPTIQKGYEEIKAT